MPITLEQSKAGMTDKVDQQVIDQFRRGSMLLDAMVFDNAVSPSTGGSTMIYGYVQLKTPATAAFRSLGSEYTPQEAVREQKSAALKIFGGASQVDRVIQSTSGLINELEFQLSEQVKGAVNLFHYSLINGDSSKNDKEFDGLHKLLTGSSTEYNGNGALDLSTSAKLDENYKTFLDMLDEFLCEFDGAPDMLLGNARLITKIRSAARRAGYLTHAEDAFGRPITGYNGIVLVDLGYYWNGTATQPTVPIYKEGETAGLTDLYAVCNGLDGFHGASPLGDKLIHTYLPDLEGPGAIKRVEVEMVAAAVLKNSRKAGVFRKIKVQ
ncbi:MAG: phage capsid protein [Provencibacterium sp.]|jgi:hypothetical protein|nr:phage capsid protein [Provencibacterium sp.]